MIDDEEHTMSDHRKALRGTGNHVLSSTSLIKSIEIIEQSLLEDSQDALDLVIIDLLLPAQTPPAHISRYYESLKNRRDNQGQALGQWLWESAGARINIKGPAHCYFTSLSPHYSFHSDNSLQEFVKTEDTHKFILEKTLVRPRQLNSKLIEIMQLWQQFKNPDSRKNQSGATS